MGAKLSEEERRCLEDENIARSLMEGSFEEEDNDGGGSSEVAGSLRRRGKIQEESSSPSSPYCYSSVTFIQGQKFSSAISFSESSMSWRQKMLHFK